MLERGREGFVLSELLIYLIVLGLILSMLVPKISTRYDEQILKMTTDSFVADYYYALNLSIIEYKTIYITVYNQSKLYTITDSTGTLYRRVTYDYSINIDYNFKYAKLIIINGKPLVDDSITFSCDTMSTKLMVLKSGYVYEAS